MMLGWILVGMVIHVADMPFSEQYVHQGTRFVLSATSIKETTFLKVDVYVVAHYVETPDASRDRIVTAAEPQLYVLTFLRDVDRKKLAKAWLEDLDRYCVGDCAPLRAPAREIAERLPDVRRGQRVIYAVRPDEVEFLVNGRLIGTLPGPVAARTVVAAFVGPKAPERLRRDLLR